MKKLIRSCIIVLGVFFILAITKSASSQSVDFGISTPVFKILVGDNHYDRYGYDRDGYDRNGYDRDGYDRDRSYRHERNDYDRDDRYRRDRDDRYDRNDRYEHKEKPVRHQKAYYKNR